MDSRDDEREVATVAGSDSDVVVDSSQADSAGVSSNVDCAYGGVNNPPSSSGGNASSSDSTSSGRSMSSEKSKRDDESSSSWLLLQLEPPLLLLRRLLDELHVVTAVVCWRGRDSFVECRETDGRGRGNGCGAVDDGACCSLLLLLLSLLFGARLPPPSLLLVSTANSLESCVVPFI